MKQTRFSNFFVVLFRFCYVFELIVFMTRIKRHYSYYLEDGMDVLELGAAEESYLPKDIELNRLVGVGLSPKLMEQNPSLTERLVINLNKVIPDVGVEELENLGADSFDAILMANTIDFLTDPKEVFRQVHFSTFC